MQMYAREIVDTEAARLPTGSDAFASDVVGTISKPIKKPWATSQRQFLVVLFLIFSDVLVACAAWQVAIALQGIFGQGETSPLVIAALLPNIVVWIGLRAALGLYPGYGLGSVEELRRQTLALLATLTITLVFAFASQTGASISRILIFGWILNLLLMAPVARYCVERAIMRAGLWGKPVVVFGARKDGARMLKVLQREWQLGFKPVGVFDNRLAPTGGVLEGVPYGGTLTEALALARERRVNTAIFAMPQTPREHLARFVELAGSIFRHTIVVPDLAGITNSAVVAKDLGGTFGVEVKHNLLDPWSQRLKRVLDVGAAAVGGVLVLPLVLMLSLLVWMESRGPIFYSDQRLGRDGRLFSCLKFRTMRHDAEALLRQMLEEDDEIREEYQKYHKLRDDPRVTRIGRFLRKTSLDELPQLWNVLKGEMSLVGPRPYLPRESKDIGAAQGVILRVTPGITGPWQVSGRNHTSFRERIDMDVYYVRDWSAWLDIVLLARTVSCLLLNRNAY